MRPLRTLWLGLLAVAALSCHSTVLTLELSTGPGLTGAGDSVWKLDGRALTLAAQRTATDTLNGLAAGTYFARSVGDQAVGELKKIQLGSSDVSTRLTVQKPAADAARSASGTFAPGMTLSLAATDSSGVTYTLLVPGNSFASSATITLTPHSRALLDFANGNGFDIQSNMQPQSPVFVEVTGGSADASLAQFDFGRQIWAPIPGTVDDGGVRFYQLDHFSTYSEVQPTPVVNGPVSQGVDSYAAYQAYSGAIQDALGWISAHHPDGGALTPDEEALLGESASMMQSLAYQISDQACSDGADVEALQLAFISLASAERLGAAPDANDRMTAVLERCLGQIRARADCTQAIAAGDVVMVEIQRQLLGQGAKMAAALANDSLAREINSDLADCTPGGGNCYQGNDTTTDLSTTDDGPFSPGSGVTVDRCDPKLVPCKADNSGCVNLCSNWSGSSPNLSECYHGCIAVCEERFACGFSFEIIQIDAYSCIDKCICFGVIPPGP